MSLLFPALQKFYNALRLLNQFSVEKSFFENIGCLDTFLTEYRSVTFALQKSLGRKDDPIYIKNRNEFLAKDKNISDWFIDNRNVVDHEHPFKLKKQLRVVIYDTHSSVEFKKYEQTVEKDSPEGDYLTSIRNTILSVAAPEIYFSAQYVFVDEDDNKETNIFDFIDKGIVAMWRFLHAMKTDLGDNSEVCNKLMTEVDGMVRDMPQRWMIDSMDYCYYRSTDSFERGESFTMMLPDIRIPKRVFMSQIDSMGIKAADFYEGFIYFHTFAYLGQQRNLLTTFFIEYTDGTYQTIAFSGSLRTTIYRYINRVAGIVAENDIANVYLVAETVGYGGFDKRQMGNFLQLNYDEKRQYRVKTFLSFIRISVGGLVTPFVIDTDTLVDRLSVSVAMGNLKNGGNYHIFDVMLTPIINSFKKKKN